MSSTRDRIVARPAVTCNETVAGNENGSAIALALLIIVALSLTSLMAVNMTLLDSTMMRNNRDYRTSLYRAETGITLAVETCKDTWLAPDSDLFDETLADASILAPGFTLTDQNGDDLPVLGRYLIARIEENPAEDSPSRQFYEMGHKAPAAVGSGFSTRDFEIRRYGIRSTGLDPRGRDGVTVEAGLSKSFNKF